MRKIFFALLFIASMLCWAIADAQYTPLGSYLTTANNRIVGSLQVEKNIRLSQYAATLGSGDTVVLYITRDSLLRAIPLSYVKGSGGGSGSADSNVFLTIYREDTAKANLRQQIAAMSGGGADSSIFNTNYRADTAKQAIYLYLWNLSDTAQALLDSVFVLRGGIEANAAGIAYNLTRIDGLSDTASIHADTLEAHKDWLSSIESEIAGIPIIDSTRYIAWPDTTLIIATQDYVNNAIPAASGLQQVLDNGDTSNRDFVINRSSYTGTTKIGDGNGAFIPPNTTRVSFYVSSKTSGQGAGSGVGYGIQAVAEYRDTVGFLSSTTLQGATGTVVASASTSSGGLHDHDFTNNSASANMSGLVGSALTFDSAYTTSAAAVVGLADALQQSHMRFATNFLSIGTRRRTGTIIDSLAGVFIQQRNNSLGSGFLGQNYGIWIDPMLAGTNNYGVFFKNNPNGGSMASAAGHDISIKSGAATKIHSSAYIEDTTFSQGEVYSSNLPTGEQDTIVYIGPDGRHYKGAVPDTIAAGDGIVATNGARTVTLTVDTTYLETMFFKNYGNSFGDDFKMGNMNWNQFIYGDGNGDFIFNNGSGPGWMFHFVQNNLDTPVTINTQNELLVGSVANSPVDAGSYKLQVQGNVYIRDSIYIANPLKAATKDTVLAWQSGKVYAIPKPAGGSADSSTFFTNYRADTMRTNIYGAISASGLAWSDTNVIATKYDIDTVNAKIPDVSNFISWTDTVSDIATKYDVDTLATSIYGAGYLPAASAASTYVSLAGSYSNPTWITALAWSKITGTPTTLSGYAISDAQPLDGDLTAIAALSPTNDDILQRKSGAWTNRSMAQLKTDLALTKTDVGLSNVDNTADASKNVATAAALTTGRTIDNTTFDGTANIKLNRPWQGKLAGETDTLTTGVKLTFRMPYAATITGVKAAVNTASSSGNITIDIHENGTTIMTTNKITIEATETTSLDATQQPVLTDTSIAADALMTIEVDAAGTNAISGEVTIFYTLQ